MGDLHRLICFGFGFTWVLFGRVFWVGWVSWWWLRACGDFVHFSGLPWGLLLVWGWYNMEFLGLVCGFWVLWFVADFGFWGLSGFGGFRVFGFGFAMWLPWF